MNYPVVTVSACMAALAALLIVAGCTSSSYDGKMNFSRETTPFSPGDRVPATCGFTTCHGLDLACGNHAPEACTMLYQLGDKCRQYADCVSGSGGTCSLVTGPRFASCKACVEKCGRSDGSDPQQAFACEEKC